MTICGWSCRGGHAASYGHVANVALEDFLALAVAGVASGVGNGVILGVAQVFSHLRLQSTLHQFLGEKLEHAVLTNEASGFLNSASSLAISLFVTGIYLHFH